MFMQDYSFKKCIENAEGNVKRHFSSAINPFDEFCHWREKMLSKVINENTVKKNRYFHLVANFIDCVSMEENREFINSLGSPEGDGWRAIKRYLKMFEKRAYERLVAFKHPSGTKMRETWKEYGRVLEGKELADISFRYNFCTRWENPNNIYSKNCVLLFTECGHFIQMDWSDPYRPIVDEIQSEKNDWPFGFQIIWLIKERRKNPKKWENISFNMECFEKEHYYYNQIGGLILKALAVEGEAYDCEIARKSREILVHYRKDKEFRKTGWHDYDVIEGEDKAKLYLLLKKIKEYELIR